MAREATSTDFQIDVEGVGSYIFSRRKLTDSYKIRGMYAQITGGNYDDDGRMHDLSALAYCTIKVLAVEQPKDFHIEKIDPIIDDPKMFEEKLVKVFLALSAKEQSFRPKPAQGSEAEGAADGEDIRPVVPEDVPAGAN